MCIADLTLLHGRPLSLSEFNQIIDTNSTSEAPLMDSKGFSLGHWYNHPIKPQRSSESFTGVNKHDI